MYTSIFNGKVLKNKNALSLHLKQFDISLLNYLIKYEGFKIPKCVYCQSNAKQTGDINGIYFNKTCGSKECLYKIQHNRKHSEETKEKIRQGRFNYMKNNYEKTPWFKSTNSLMTYGEEFLHKKLTELNFYSNYDIVCQYPIYPYFIDFAFINEKIALEFDGACHFINNERIEHDIIRDEKLNRLGWRVFRITYKELTDFDFTLLSYFIKNNSELSNKKLENRLILYKEIKPIKINKQELKTFKYVEDQLILAEKLVSSNINFSKLGWVKEASLIINQPTQHVSDWLKRFLPDFYEQKCFKRNVKIN